MTEWQDILTAPKDGTSILAAHCDAVFDAWWGGNAWVDGETNEWGDYITLSPTHWMPLPAPPPKDNTND
jgi:hypothetical protein